MTTVSRDEATTGTLPESRPFDAVSVLTVWLGLLFLIPSGQVVEQVGSAGKPAVLWAYGLLIMWLASRFVPSAVMSGRQPMRWALGLYLIALILSYSLGIERGLADAEITATDRAIITQVSVIAVALVALDGIPSRERLDALMLRLIGFAAAASTVGVLQFFFSFNLVEHVPLPGLGLHQSDAVGSLDTRNGFNRVSGTAGHAIEFGAVTGMVLPISLHYLLHDRPGTRRRWLAVASFLILMGIPISISRTSVVSVAIVGAVLASSWTGRMWIRMAMIAVAGGAVLRAAVPSLIGSTLNLFVGLGDDTSFTARTNDYPIVFRFIRERLWFGRGPGTFGPTGYVLLDNEILSTTVNCGLVGLATLLLLYVIAISVSRRTLWTASSNETRHLANSLVASIMVALAVLFFADMKFFTMYLGLAFFFFGVSGALSRFHDDQGEFDVKPRWYLKAKLRAVKASPRRG